MRFISIKIIFVYFYTYNSLCICVQFIIRKVCLFIWWKYKKLKICMCTNICFAPLFKCICQHSDKLGPSLEPMIVSARNWLSPTTVDYIYAMPSYIYIYIYIYTITDIEHSFFINKAIYIYIYIYMEINNGA